MLIVWKPRAAALTSSFVVGYLIINSGYELMALIHFHMIRYNKAVETPVKNLISEYNPPARYRKHAQTPISAAIAQPLKAAIS